MSQICEISAELMKVNQAELETIAEKLSCLLSKGDTLFLKGDLGAGKSTFARALIKSLANNSELEVQSPTFPILIPYETAKADISHYDLYRISDFSEVEELGLYDELDTHITLIEWPEQLGQNHNINDRFEIGLEEAEQEKGKEDHRLLTVKAFGKQEKKLERFCKIGEFLEGTDWQNAQWQFLQGDASTRSYIRLRDGASEALLMNAPPQPDGPPIRDGKPYSQIAHLAEDMASFVAVSNALIDAGLSAPKVHKFNIKDGLLLINDLGDHQLYHMIVEENANQQNLYETAIDILCKLREHKPSPMKVGEGIYQLPSYSHEALSIEAELVIDWYWPKLKNTKISDSDREHYQKLWAKMFDCLAPNNNHWVLRDFHSPNLMYLPNESGVKSIGIIDFQDAVLGHAAYDVVSLCQDARITVPKDVEQHLLSRYLNQAESNDPSFDKEDFLKAYAILGAQRASKLLGIFVRLAVRDGKKHYLAHIPRIWDYLERNLKHPHLIDIFNWYETHFPDDLRIKSEEDLSRVSN
ncbi:MAG: tRNA (adenosine(37)-N6)-threonylcarbamoyltransferase complex ATPase subunit type 1 TsaE [Rhizobiales bacterium]|nr:tRNA (adenosine(37)-N6)-threonylcarbamoyltransferase complex ATPase subunit type 1 TsaE [Hyphomicrobiales bacterium]